MYFTILCICHTTTCAIKNFLNFLVNYQLHQESIQRPPIFVQTC
jgi:hypothetical protein